MKRTAEFAKLKIRYQKLKKSITPHQRGRQFEKLLSDVLSLEDLEPRTSYRPKGEEIDGSFFWNGQTILLEAKWHASPLPASSIYTFKGKLDGKFHTTSGVFISMSGYGDETENVLRFGKLLNILLFDQQDLDAIFFDNRSFLEVFLFKLRQAGDVGSLYIPFPRKKDITEEVNKDDNTLDFSEWLETLAEQRKKFTTTLEKEFELLLFVEGRKDLQPVLNILNTLPHTSKIEFKVIPLGGVNGIRKLPDYLSLHQAGKASLGAVIILDDDMRTTSIQQTIELVKDQLGNAAIFIPLNFTFISETEIKIWQQLQHDTKVLRKQNVYSQIVDFIQAGIDEYYYDPVRDIPQEAINGAMERVDWNYRNKIVTVTYEDEYSSYKDIDSLSDLVEYLDEVAVEAMHGEMSTEWLKDQTMGLDYTIEAQEFLLNNYAKEIKKMGWTDADW